MPTKPTGPAGSFMGVAGGGKPPVRTFYDFESRLSGCMEVKSLLKPRQINRICSIPISAAAWGITRVFPGREHVLLFEALEAYVGPIAGDPQFSRRMDAAAHTQWVIQALERLNLSFNAISAKGYYVSRGLNGLSDCVPIIKLIGDAYRKLFSLDRKALMIAALLHDVGKATGRRERHPLVGLEKLNATPSIMENVRAILATTHTAEEVITAEMLIKLVVGDHDLIGGIALTRDRNIFEGALAIMAATPDPRLRQKALNFIALVNFADIDGQSEKGIFTDDKVVRFYKAYRELASIVEKAGGKTVHSAKDLTDGSYDFNWWGKQRALAWSRGDNTTVSEQKVLEIIDHELPEEPARRSFFETLGELSLFDGIYNLSTAIHEPKVAVNFLVWVARLIKDNKVNAVTYNSSLLTNPGFVIALKKMVESGGEFAEMFGLTFIRSGDKTILNLYLPGTGS